MGQKMVECKKYFLVKLNDTWMPKSEHARAGVLMNAFLLTVVRGWSESGVYKTKIMYSVVPNQYIHVLIPPLLSKVGLQSLPKFAYQARGCSLIGM